VEIEDDEQPCIISDSPHKFVLHQRSERVLCKFTEIEGCLVVDSSPLPMGFRSRRFPCLEGSPEVIYAAVRISEQSPDRQKGCSRLLASHFKVPTRRVFHEFILSRADSTWSFI
jgi:hypothetical protein